MASGGTTPPASGNPLDLATAVSLESVAGICAIYVAIRLGFGTPADPNMQNPQTQQYITEAAQMLKSFLVFLESGDRLTVDDKGFIKGFPLPTGGPAPFSG